MYRKPKGIIPTLNSIINQDFPYPREIILLDDNSGDETPMVAEEITQDFPFVTIVKNSENRGPSVRLNQGAKIARGDYLHFFDHDDILPKNAISLMYDGLEQSGAEFIYGKWKITENSPEELLGIETSATHPLEVIENPVDFVISGRFLRMCALVKREHFLKAGGFDDKIFIQDQSLPLRLALDAKKMAITDAIVSLVPRFDGNLSENETQLNHDRFLAYRNFYFLLMGRGIKNNSVFSKAVSAVWKEKRRIGEYSYLPLYFISRYFPFLLPQKKILELSSRFFSNQKVLRP